MSFFSKVTDFLTGGIGGTLIQEISKHFPPGMSEADKAAMTITLSQLTHAQQMELLKIAQEEDIEFNKRIADLEGTAADLKGVPILGPIVLFIRGLQRPVWSFATMFVDFRWFSGDWTFDTRQDSAAYIINVLVLGFLFGERAMQNVLPYVAQVFKAKNGDPNA